MFLTLLKVLVKLVTRSRETTETLPDGVEVRQAKWIPALGGIFTKRTRPMAAVTIGRTIVVHPERVISQRLIRHELVHVSQWEKYGITFPFRYTTNHIRHGYLENPFEKEADKAE